MKDERPILAVTAGDPAGVGPEVTVKALADPSIYRVARPVVYADRCVLESALRLCGLATAVHVVRRPAEALFAPGTIDLIDAGTLTSPPPAGLISAAGGRAGFAYLEQAIAAALAGEADALVTAPLNKESLQAAAVPYVDHTDTLRARAALTQTMTLFMVRSLRIFFLTRHIPFRAIADAVTAQDIAEAVPSCLRYLGQLGIENPSLAVAALNPHGGEQGLFGREEMDVIAPAVAAAQQRGYRVTGPVPADAVFHRALTGHYDGVLSLYHDQGHIAAKTLDFHGTVSLTMGLKFLRTSVDHGTAFDIAGKGIADASGMVNALQAAAQYGLVVKARLNR